MILELAALLSDQSTRSTRTFWRTILWEGVTILSVFLFFGICVLAHDLCVHVAVVIDMYLTGPILCRCAYMVGIGAFLSK